MQIKNLYRYARDGGGVTTSPEMPEKDYTLMYRIIADENKAVTKNGADLYPAIDTDSAEGWYEVDAPADELTEENIVSISA